MWLSDSSGQNLNRRLSDPGKHFYPAAGLESTAKTVCLCVSQDRAAASVLTALVSGVNISMWSSASVEFITRGSWD